MVFLVFTGTCDVRKQAITKFTMILRGHFHRHLDSAVANNKLQEKFNMNNMHIRLDEKRHEQSKEEEQKRQQGG